MFVGKLETNPCKNPKNSGQVARWDKSRIGSAPGAGIWYNTPRCKRESERGSDMDLSQVIAKELGIEKWQTDAVIRLLDEGNTIPFIARYRKEQHGALDDAKLRALEERLRYLRGLEERKRTILSAIEEQGKLTKELSQKIGEAMTQTALEDLYRPYRQKRRTRGAIAREKGLQPLADYLKNPAAKNPVEKEAAGYVNPGAGVADAAAAIHMAQDILAEELSDNADIRKKIRDLVWKEGILTCGPAPVKKKEEAEAPKNKKLAARRDVYDTYLDFHEPVAKLPGYRILAINRGEAEKFLSVKIEMPEEEIGKILLFPFLAEERAKGQTVHSFRELRAQAAPVLRENPVTISYLREACRDAWKRLLAPSIENEIRGTLTERAEEGAMKVFSANLEQLLMQPPVAGKTVLGWDPAFRTGCKLAVADPTGKILDTAVIYPTEPQNKVEEAKKTLLALCRKYHVDLVSCGNGTASRESEKIITDFIRESGLPIQLVIVNEAGASVYSASELASEEFPNFDVGQRSAASIARRLQDPLAELVKIDPRSIGVGQYQHDMNQTKLGETLTGVVESCVNRVGVDVNTASAALLSYISGIGPTLAKNIVTCREEHGAFRTRKDLLTVKGLGPKAFEQCAGFLRIRGGSEPLDGTGVHPESYEAARVLLKELGYRKEDVQAGKTSDIETRAGSGKALEKLCETTGLGRFTLQDILKELAKPGRDPREKVAGAALSQEVREIKDLKEGMVLSGTVRNIVDFGAFVDIGVHQDGLVHISQLADHFVKNPLDVVRVGDIVRVKVLSVDEKKNRIGLSMKGVDQKA